jgi:hypothetical protein
VLAIVGPEIVDVESAAKWQTLVIRRNQALFWMIPLILLCRIVNAVRGICRRPVVVAEDN